MMGAIAAAPLFPNHPLAASFVLMGSVLPDMDVLSGVFGRKTMMRFHQTVTHSVFGVVIAVALCALLMLSLAREVPGAMFVELALCPVTLGLGMCVHILTDWTNTFGVMWLAPWRRERVCLEWVFFIDGFVIAANTLTLGLLAWSWSGPGATLSWITVVHFTALAGYWAWRAWWRARAGRQAPEGTLSLVPSAIWPHRFYGCRLMEGGGVIELFEWDALAGDLRGEPESLRLLDRRWKDALDAIPEVGIMRALSPAYFAIEEADGVVVCKDLRTRNFETSFGRLDLRVEEDGGLSMERWYV